MTDDLHPDPHPDPHHDPHHDPQHDLLRRAVDDAVSDVEPAHRLGDIRARTRRATRTRRSWWVGGAVLAAAAAVVAAVVPVTVTEPSADTPVDPAAVEPDAPETRPAPEGARGVARAVYYVGETSAGPRLYREYRPMPRGTEADVVDLATTQSAEDPDYRTAWPSGLSGFVHDGEGDDAPITVELPEQLREAPEGMPAHEAVLAVQQVVYTTQAVVGAAAPVLFTDAAGTAHDRVLGVDVPEGGFVRDPSALAPVNVFDPGQGLRVSRAFTATGVELSGARSVPWQLLDLDGEVVAEGTADVDGPGGLGAWRTVVDVSGLEPGVHTFVVTSSTASATGASTAEDTRTIVVEDGAP